MSRTGPPPRASSSASVSSQFPLPNSPQSDAAPLKLYYQVVEPPEWMQRATADDGAAARERVRRASSSQKMFGVFIKKGKESVNGKPDQGVQETRLGEAEEGGEGGSGGEGSGQPNGSQSLPPPTPGMPIDVDEPDGWQDEQTKDLYRWAILYENQRGATIFSVPHYSTLTLLPFDPPAFTTPGSSPSPSRSTVTYTASPSTRQHHGPTMSIADYPLPDGNWRWLSKAWMIDMQEDGAVSHDGFEYNMWFKQKGWKTGPSWGGLGGFVRRRRWVRLMVRPSGGVAGPVESDIEGSGTRSGEGASRVEDEDDDEQEEDPEVIWQGDEDDWARCTKAMKKAGRDGLIVDLWRGWIEKPDSTEDMVVSSHENSQDHDEQLEHIAKVLNLHGTEILNYLVFPASRVEFLRLVSSNTPLKQKMKSELADKPDEKVKFPSVRSSVDFWSQVRGLEGDVLRL